MSKAYVKLFQRILDSSIWDEPDPVRIMWVTMMAMADDDGVVRATKRRLAINARVSDEWVDRALERFLSPDPSSLTSAHEGRRIEKVEGGWLLLNYHKYRVMMDREDALERDRERKRTERAAAARNSDETKAIRKLSNRVRRGRPTAAEAVAGKVLAGGGTVEEAEAAVDGMRPGEWPAGHRHDGEVLGGDRDGAAPAVQSAGIGVQIPVQPSAAIGVSEQIEHAAAVVAHSKTSDGQRQWFDRVEGVQNYPLTPAPLEQTTTASEIVSTPCPAGGPAQAVVESPADAEPGDDGERDPFKEDGE